MRWRKQYTGTLDKFELYYEDLQKGAKRGFSALTKKRAIKSSNKGWSLATKRSIEKGLAKIGTIKKRVRQWQVTISNRYRK